MNTTSYPYNTYTSATLFPSNTPCSVMGIVIRSFSSLSSYTGSLTTAQYLVYDPSQGLILITVAASDLSPPSGYNMHHFDHKYSLSDQIYVIGKNMPAMVIEIESSYTSSPSSHLQVLTLTYTVKDPTGCTQRVQEADLMLASLAPPAQATQPSTPGPLSVGQWTTNPSSYTIQQAGHYVINGTTFSSSTTPEPMNWYPEKEQKVLECQCGKDKHGFACHMTFCDKYTDPWK